MKPPRPARLTFFGRRFRLRGRYQNLVRSCLALTSYLSNFTDLWLLRLRVLCNKRDSNGEVVLLVVADLTIHLCAHEADQHGYGANAVRLEPGIEHQFQYALVRRSLLRVVYVYLQAKFTSPVAGFFVCPAC